MTEFLNIPRKRPLGPFEVGTLAYGCWRLAASARGEVETKIETALDIGANLIDTADIYGYPDFGQAEQILGDLLAGKAGLRERMVLVTKGGIQPPIPYDSRTTYLIGAAEASLRRLRTDRVDLYLIHRPDLLAAHADVAEALTRLRDQGKIREAGVSNYTVAQTRALQSMLDFPLLAIQPEISPLCVDALTDGMLDLAQEMGLTPMAWSPLAGGALMAEHPKDPRVAAVAEALDEIGPRDAAAFAWLMAHPAGSIPIIGSQSAERIRAAAAAHDIQMTRRQWYAVLEAALGTKMP